MFVGKINRRAKGIDNLLENIHCRFFHMFAAFSRDSIDKAPAFSLVATHQRQTSSEFLGISVPCGTRNS
jgi:hypothetical protein